MAGLEETYPRLIPKIEKARAAGYSDEEIQGHLQQKMQRAFKAGYTPEEVNAYLGEVPKPTITEDLGNDLGKLGALAKELVVDQPAATLQRGLEQLGTAAGPAKEGENRAMNVVYGIGNIALSPLSVFRGLQKLAFGDPAVALYQGATGRSGEKKLPIPELGGWMGKVDEKELVSMFGEILGSSATTKALLAVPGMASRLFAEVFGYGKPAEADNLKAFQKTLREIQADDLKGAEKARVQALKQADEGISKWVEELTGKKGAVVKEAADTAEESMVNRFLDVEARAGKPTRSPAAGDLPSPVPPGKPTELPAYPRDVTPSAPERTGVFEEMSQADRQLFEQQRARAMVERAAEGSEFAADQYIEARAGNRGTPDFERTPIPRGEGEPTIWRQGPEYGGSRGTKMAREDVAGGTVREPARLGLPSPDKPAPPPPAPPKNEPPIESLAARIKRMEAENEKLRAQVDKPAPPPPRAEEAPVFTSAKEPPEVSAATVQELKRGLAEEQPVGIPESPMTPEQQGMAARAQPAAETIEQKIARMEAENAQLKSQMPEDPPAPAVPQQAAAMTEEEALRFVNNLRQSAREGLQAEGVKNPNARQIKDWLDQHPEVTGNETKVVNAETKPPQVETPAPKGKTPAPAPETSTLRPAIRVDGEIKGMGEAGAGHAQIAELQSKAFDEYFSNPKAKIESGWVDDTGKWFDSKEAAVSSKKRFIDLVKDGYGSETGSVGALTPEQAAREAQARADRAEAYRRIVELAKSSGKSAAKAAEEMGISPTLYRRMFYEHTIDQSVSVLGKLADDLTQANERAKLIEPEVPQISLTGHMTKEARDLVREQSWGNKKPITYDNWISQKFKDINENQLVAVGRSLSETRKAMVEMGDSISADEASRLTARFNAVQKEFNRLANQRSKIQFAAGRIVESFRRPAAAFPEDVIEELRNIGHMIETNRKLRERVPIDSAIVESIGKVLKEKSWSALSDREKDIFLRNLVDSNRLNLFAPFSPVLDLVSNAAEGTVQFASGFMGDIVHLAKGGRSLPATEGMIRSIGLRRSGNRWAGIEVAPRRSALLDEKLGYTFGGEAVPGNVPISQLVHKPADWLKEGIFRTDQQGVFTRRSNQLSAGYDTLKGTVMYGKSAMDSAFKRFFGSATIWREGILEADKQGLRGVDRQRFLDDFWANLPQTTLDQAVADANKAGWNRPLSHWEEKFARSSLAKIFVDPFARWSFQFARWGGEMLGYNPTIMRKMIGGTASAEEITRYLTRTATGWGGAYAIDRWFNQNENGYVDYSSGEWVEAKTGNRQRLSSFEPIMSALFLGQLVKAGASAARGDHAAMEEHLDKATGAMRFASIPFLRAIYGDSGMLGGVMGQLRDAAVSGRWDRKRLVDEFTDAANRAIPGQALLSAMEHLTDPELREGLGAKLPGVSKFTDKRIDMSTGGSIEPEQIVLGARIPSFGGTPLPGAKRVLQPVAATLSRYGILEYRGPRLPIAGYRGAEAPDNVTREWEIEFGKARNQILAPILPSIKAAEFKVPPSQLTPGKPQYEYIRGILQKHDNLAARHATNVVNQRHLGQRTMPRRPTVREQRSASEVD